MARFEYSSAAKIDTIMEKARRANFNIVYFQVRGAADAFYDSDLEPCAARLCGRLGAGRPSWDPLSVAIAAAHARGLELHAWLNALSGWGSGTHQACNALTESELGYPRHILKEHPEWGVVNNSGALQPCPNGEEYIYQSPGNPEVRTRLARVAADIARRYPVDGIHLDRIRIPGTAWSYDAASLNAFGKSPVAFSTEWNHFRRQLVNLTVAETYDSLKSVKPALPLSAAVWPIYQDRWAWNASQGYSQYFQDPRAWAIAGYLDVAVPMTYSTINSQYCSYTGTPRNPDWLCLLDDHLEGIQQAAGRHIYIGVSASKGGASVREQIARGRERGAKGFAVYSYSTVEGQGLWTVLQAGPFARPATIPAMPWR